MFRSFIVGLFVLLLSFSAFSQWSQSDSNNEKLNLIENKLEKLEKDNEFLILKIDIADIADKNNQTFHKNIYINNQRQSEIMKAVGGFQLICGITGIICTIIDANKEYNFSTPTYNSKTQGLETKNLKVKNKWQLGHTISTVLSGGMILSGIITVNF